MSELEVCPASTEKKLDGVNLGINAGRACWALAGTFCKGKIQGTFASKLHDCLECDFYQLVRKEEGKKFKMRTTVKLNALGLKCPQPVLKIASASADLREGNILEVLADCPTFEKDVRIWCERVKKTLLWIKDEGNGKKCCHIQF